MKALSLESDHVERQFKRRKIISSVCSDRLCCASPENSQWNVAKCLEKESCLSCRTSESFVTPKSTTSGFALEFSQPQCTRSHSVCTLAVRIPPRTGFQTILSPILHPHHREKVSIQLKLAGRITGAV